MAYEDTTHGSAQQDAFQALGGNAGPQGVRPQQAETAAIPTEVVSRPAASTADDLRARLVRESQ